MRTPFKPLKIIVHGYDIHGLSGCIGNVNANRHRRGVVYVPPVHVADSARPYGSDRDGLPCIQGSPTRKGSQTTLGIVAAFMTVLLGLSFAFPATAGTTIYDGELGSYGCTSGWTYIAHETNEHYTSYTLTAVIHVNASTTITGINFEDYIAGGWADNFDPMGDQTLTLSANGLTSVTENLAWDRYIELKPQVFYVDLSLPAGTSTVSINQTGDGDIGYPHTSLAQADCSVEIYGDEDEWVAPETSEGESLPTSTYDGTFSELLPTIGFGSDALMSSSTNWTGHLNAMIGSATGTFPLCFVSPLFQLMDYFQGSMATGTSETIVISGGMFPTSTFSMEGVNPILADMGIKPYADVVFPVVEGLLWLYFGWCIFTAVFATGSSSEDTL
jgi:hypothetical protein